MQKRDIKKSDKPKNGIPCKSQIKAGNTIEEVLMDYVTFPVSFISKNSGS